MKLDIVIYNDVGVSKRSLQAALTSMNLLFNKKYNIRTVDGSYINNESWANRTALFIMPGGYSRPHYKLLANGGNQKIINFVHSGGKYLGICSGAYYGSEKTVFEEGNELEVKLNGPLNFFNGTAYGPAYGLGKFAYDSERGTVAAKINWPNDINREAYIYLNGGCYFIDSNNSNNGEYQVLSRFLDISGAPPAIVKSKVGKGIAVLSGVHFEFSPELIDVATLSSKAIIDTLKRFEVQRIEFLKEIMLSFKLDNSAKI